MRAIPPLVAALLLGAVPMATALTAQNDAGIGGDAPDGTASPNFPLLRPGSYTGGLLFAEGDREDWYRVTLLCTQTYTVRATSGAFYAGIYTAQGLLQQGRTTGAPVSFTLAPGAYTIGLGEQRTTGSAAYEMSLFATPGVVDDAGTGCDAPDNGASVPTPLGTFTGRLSYTAGDREDWYVFHVPCAGIRVEVASTSGSFYAGLYDGGLRMQSYHDAGEVATLRAVGSGVYALGIGDAEGLGAATYRVTTSKLQNDAGSGCDATAAGLPVSGTWNGRLDYDAGDSEDWYDVTSTGCAVREVTFRAQTGAAYFGAYDDKGSLVAQSALGEGDEARWEVLSGPLRIGVGDGAGLGIATYSVSVRVVAALPPIACIAGGVGVPR